MRLAMIGLTVAASLSAGFAIAAPVKPPARPAPPAATPHAFLFAGRVGDILVYWDAASVRRVEGGFTFDTLDVSYSTLVTFADGRSQVTASLGSVRKHVKIACDWRTVSSMGDSDKTWPSPGFQSSRTPYGPALDQLCSGVEPPQGLGSVAEVQARARTQLPRPEGIPPPMASASPQDPAPPAWLTAASGFHAVNTPDPRARLFLSRDRESGGGATPHGVSLAIPGAAPGRTVYDESPIAVARRVRYDCAARTLTVEGQAVLDRYDMVVSVDDKPSAPREAVSSPVIASEIASACGARAPAEPEQPDIYAVLAVARDASPPIVRAWRTSCLWKALNADQRQYYAGAWERRQETIRRRVDLAPQWQSCGVPDEDDLVAQIALREKAIQYGAIQRLIDRHGFQVENRILAAWRAQPEAVRRRFTRPYVLASDAERSRQTALVLAIGAQLRFKTTDDFVILEAYLKSQASLEFRLELAPEPA